MNVAERYCHTAPHGADSTTQHTLARGQGPHLARGGDEHVAVVVGSKHSAAVDTDVIAAPAACPRPVLHLHRRAEEDEAVVRERDRKPEDREDARRLGKLAG